MRYILLMLLLASFAAAEIVIVNETEKDFYALEQIVISGDLQDNSLDISGEGTVISGSDVRVYLVGPSSDLVIENVYVNNDPAPVSFDNKGYFIVMQKGDFSFTGTMLIRSIGQLQLYVPGPVNAMRFNLQHGYAVSGDQYGLYGKQVTIQRSEKAAMLVDGSFRYTYADRNEFYYLISFKSFGSTLGSYTVSLPNKEQVIGVTGAIKWQQQGSSLILDLEGSDATVSINGLFDSNQLIVPLNEGLSRVLIESDAEKRITISTDAKETDLSESSLPYTFPNARAFLARPGNFFSINIKTLAVMPSLSATVDRATMKVAINEQGSVVGELNYNYKNTGVDYIEIDAPGTPLYASTQSGPVKLTKEDKLLLSFPKSDYGSLDFVYFTTVDPPQLIDIIDIPLAKTDLPITQQTTTIFVPKDFYIVNLMGAKGGSELPSFRAIVIYGLLVGGLAFWYKRNWKFITAYLVFATGLFLFHKALLLMLMSVTLFIILKKYMEGFKWWKWVLIGAGVLAVIIVGIIALVGLMNFGVMSKGGNYEYAMDDIGEVREALAPSYNKGMQTVGEADGAISVPMREGVLPVKMSLPSLGKQISVTNYLVTKENQVSLKLFMVKTWLIYLYYLVALLAGYVCYKNMRN
jgi:hypothetical protein